MASFFMKMNLRFGLVQTCMLGSLEFIKAFDNQNSAGPNLCILCIALIEITKSGLIYNESD